MILVDVFSLQIIQKLASTRDHLEQSAAGVIVFLVNREMLGQLIDPLR